MNSFSIADSLGFVDRAVLFYSTGKDANATLDVIAKRAKHIKICVVYMYHCHPEIEYRNKYLSVISKKYGVDIHKEPGVDFYIQCKKHGRNITIPSVAQVEDRIKEKYGCEWTISGAKLADSFSRRIYIKDQAPEGIDRKSGRIYPLKDWSETQVFKYCKINNIVLPEEYRNGFRDIGVYKGKALLWLHREHREDYERIIKDFPLIEADYIRAKEKYVEG